MPEGSQPNAARDKPTIEAIVAVEPPREFRIHPTDRMVAYTDGTALRTRRPVQRA